jgi:type I restriction enzyme S subunit
MSEFRNYEHTGTVFGSINKEQFEKIKIVIPDERIVSKFESIVNGIDDQIYNLCKQSQTLSALRDTLLPKLMSGELRVPEEIVNKYEGIN